MNIIALIFSLLMLANSAAPSRSEPTAPPYDLGHGLVYGVDYTECDAETEARIREGWGIKASKEEPDPTKAICAFDISESGRLAVATADEQILVYDAEMNFEYVIEFESPGLYGVLWAGENVALLQIRSNWAYVLSDNGKLICCYEMNEEKGYDYWSDIVEVTERQVGNQCYYMDDYELTLSEDATDGFALGYKELRMTDSSGNDRVLYRANEEIELSDYLKIDPFYIMAFILLVLLIVLLPFIALAGIIYLICKAALKLAAYIENRTRIQQVSRKP